MMLPLQLFAFSCKEPKVDEQQNWASVHENDQASNQKKQQDKTFYDQLSDAAVTIIDPNIRYIPDYIVLKYPGGDVPANTGVCTDVIVRAYRKLDIDLQQLVHEDMSKNFKSYPQKWGLKRPDKNIDHRRVPNLMKFFSKFGSSLPLSTDPGDYLPGDIVTWNLPNGMTHIGIVIDQKSRDGIPLIVHNIGNGQVAENCLFKFEMTGHYRYGESQK